MAAGDISVALLFSNSTDTCPQDNGFGALGQASSRTAARQCFQPLGLYRQNAKATRLCVHEGDCIRLPTNHRSVFVFRVG